MTRRKISVVHMVLIIVSFMITVVVYAAIWPGLKYVSILRYKTQERKDARGEYEVVIFPDGSECSDGDFFYRGCGKKWSYCEQHGGRIEIRSEKIEKIAFTYNYPVCLFSDGSECVEYDYAIGACKPGQKKNAEIKDSPLCLADGVPIHCSTKPSDLRGR